MVTVNSTFLQRNKPIHSAYLGLPALTIANRETKLCSWEKFKDATLDNQRDADTICSGQQI